MWELRALTGASRVAGVSHVAPALWFLPRERHSLGASLARLLYLEQGWAIGRYWSLVLGLLQLAAVRFCVLL